MKNIYKKIVTVVVAVLLFCSTKTFAQDEAYQQGNSIISVGYGFPNLTDVVFTVFNSNPGYSISAFGPIHFKYEYALNHHWGLGITIGYEEAKVQWENTDYVYDPNTGYYDIPVSYAAGYKGSNIGILARANYHFLTSSKFDPYFGFALGYNDWAFTYFNDDPNYSGGGSTVKVPIPLALSVTIGCRYYFTPNIGIYAELGYEKDVIQFGFSGKFGGS